MARQSFACSNVSRKFWNCAAAKGAELTKELHLRSTVWL
jgi:hypothetical protein